MAEWVVCPSCQLKHSRRGDGLCPRCRQAVDIGEGPPPPVEPSATALIGGAVAPARSRLELEAAHGLPLGLRLLGGALALNGIALLIEKMAMRSDGGSILQSPASALVDLVLGGMLLAGSDKALALTKFRIVAGAIVLPIVHFAMGDTMTAVLQLVFSAGLLALAFGAPGRARLVAGAAAIALCLGLEATGLYAILTGSNPLARAALTTRGDIEEQPAGRVQGIKFAYQLTAPSDHWFLRKEEAAHKDNAMADRWLVRPDKDAHVFVIAEKVPGTGPITMDAFVSVVTQNGKKGSNRYTVLDQSDLATHLEAGRVLHSTTVANGIEIEGLTGLFIQGRRVFQVFGFADKKRYPDVREELQSLIASFEMAE